VEALMTAFQGELIAIIHGTQAVADAGVAV
jgi:hypothetical protein